MYLDTPYYYAQSQNLPENARGAKAITQFGAEIDTAGVYVFSGQCSVYEYTPGANDNDVQIPLQSPNNPVLEFEQGAADGDYWFVHCQVDRATGVIECGQPPDEPNGSPIFPETDYDCGYSYEQDGTSYYWSRVWYLGGNPTGSNCETFTNHVQVIADSDQTALVQSVNNTIDGL